MKIEDFLTFIPEGFIYSYDDLSNLVIKYQQEIKDLQQSLEDYRTMYNKLNHIVIKAIDILKGSDKDGM